jgi:hypothetical protein
MLRRWIRGILLCAAAAGCTGPDDRTDPSRYTPSWPEARAALIAALSDWHESSPPFPLSRTLKAIVFVDKQRKPDDRLRSFSILGQNEIENARQFTVRLEIEGEDAPRMVRYNALGRDPVWLFRLEDYEMMIHWQHPMNEEPPPAESKTPGGDQRSRQP